MLSLPQLSALALGGPAVAALAAGVLGGLAPRRGPAVARGLVRLGLVATLAGLAYLIVQLQPSGSVEVVLWRITPSLPVDLQVDVAGAAIAVGAAAAALLISLSGRDGPLAAAALGAAAAGAVLACLAGGLLSLYIGLQLSAVAGIGLSYARSPRSPSGRLVLAAAIDQAVTLIWLGAVVGLNQQTRTTLFTGIPTASITLPLAGFLLLPGVLRLGGAAAIPDRGSPEGGHRSVDLADWLAIVGVPTGLTVLLRVQQLSGGLWPNPALGTALDGMSFALALAAVLQLVQAPRRLPLQPPLMLAAALVLAGFGANSAAGTGLAVAAAIYLELCVLVGPRILSAGEPDVPSLPKGAGRAALAAANLPLSAGVTVAVVGVAVALQAGPGPGALPGLAFGASLAGLALVAARTGGARAGRLSWPMALPALALALAAVFPGGLLELVAAPMATPGGTGPLPITAPDPLSLQLPGMMWPGGYLVLAGVLLWCGALAGRRLLGEVGERGGAVLSAAPEVRAPLSDWRAVRLALTVARAAALGLRLSAREMAERPAWMWLAVTLSVAWLLVQR